MRRKLTYTIIFILSTIISGFATSYKPVVSNYSTQSYGISAGVQNWSCHQGKNGEMYFGNNRGMLSFDGYNWKLYHLPEQTICRSVFANGDSIFVGSYEDFGYYKRNSKGELVYKSLRERIHNFNMENEEIWKIIKHDGKIYFQSFSSSFIWDGKEIRIINFKDYKPLYYHQINGKIYAQLINGPYCILEKDKYRQIFSREEFGNDNIVEATQISGNRAILFSESNGLFLMSANNDVRKINTSIDKELSEAKVNRATITKDSTLIIGTILDGIYAIDLKGNLKWHYNSDTGLLNNSVLSLFCDRDNNIWAALDNGISLIHTGVPYSIMTPERGEAMLGMIYDVSIIGDYTLLATNQGLYYYNKNGKIKFTPGTGGQNWHISTFDNQTFIGNNLSTMKFQQDGTVTKIPGTEASSTCMRNCRIHETDIIIESSYHELRIYKKIDGVWTISNNIEGFAAPIRNLEIAHNGAIWAANMNRGAYRIELSSDLKKVQDVKFFKTASDSSSIIKHIMKIRGRIIFSDNKKLYTFDDLNQKIIPYDELNKSLSNTSDIHYSKPIDDNTFWLSGERGYYLMSFKDNKFTALVFIPISFFGLQNNENNDRIYIKDNVSYFNMNNGIAKYDTKIASKTRWIKPELLLTEVQYTDKNGNNEYMDIGINKDFKMPDEGSLYFNFTYPNYNNEPITFKYELSGDRNLSMTRQTPDISFHDLNFGSYKLMATVVTSTGDIIGKYEYSFSIPTPFYLSIFAIILYIATLICIIYYFSKWHTRRALEKRNNEYEAEKNKQNIKMLEQEKLINLQKQQLLQAELSNKSKELASLALDNFAKEKVIESLKDSMLTQKHKGGITPKDMDAILKQIESNIGNTEFLDIYQKNFDLIHEHFFRTLRERYPSLTASDLKFCALLRLNLNTKDIAKFTNLTIRGVEAARYRLRKKLNLTEKESLIEFLIDLK